MLATTIHESNTTHPTTKDGATTTHPRKGEQGLLSQSPIVCLADSFTDKNPAPAKRLLCTQPATHYRRRRSSPNHRFPQVWGRGNNTGAP
jgi:hypothetical protein